MTSIESLAQDPRVVVRTKGNPDSQGRCVVYWMQRSQRALDNAALNVAVQAANCLAKPVVVFFALTPHVHHANYRHYVFMLRGLRDIADRLRRRKVGFVLRRFPEHELLRFCSEVKPALVVGDENPLRRAERSKSKISSRIRVPFWTVDADVIVPSRLLGKEHYAARTIRPKIHQWLPKFLTPIANPRVKIPWVTSSPLPSSALVPALLDGLPLDRSIGSVSSLVGGAEAAGVILKNFVNLRLKNYRANRNHPDVDGTSQLSPYLHFGHIGPHTIALAVRGADALAEERKAFLEELIVRRELAINFVRFNSNYENFDSAEPWADRTLRMHARDERPYLYTEKQLENAETHDPLWNAVQKQMVLTGWMHGYLRMYWAKKILEWTPSPLDAYEIAVRLNDRYEVDGRDPNGYAGIAWAIVGKHDRAWGPERPVYGKIRYMSFASTSRKFNSKAYTDKIATLERKGSAFL
jgi:deoxyribodipyrimidine photo-lyase